MFMVRHFVEKLDPHAGCIPHSCGLYQDSKILDDRLIDLLKLIAKEMILQPHEFGH